MRSTAIDTATNRVIATIPNGQAAQALVYVPEAVPTAAAGTENLQPLGLAGAAAHLALTAPGSTNPTTVSLFDQGLTQVLQAAVVGLEPAKPYVLALTSNPDGTGRIEPIAQFMTNPAGAQIVNAVGPIRQIVDPATRSRQRRYLAIMTLENGKPGRPVQLQQSDLPDHRSIDSCVPSTPCVKPDPLACGSALGCGLRGRVFTRRPRPRPSGEAVQIEKDDGGRVERQELAQGETADDGIAERLPDFRAGAAAKHERHGAEHRGHRGHENRAEAQHAGLLVDRLFGRQTMLALGTQRKIDQHDAVFLDDADEQDNADHRYHA